MSFNKFGGRFGLAAALLVSSSPTWAVDYIWNVPTGAYNVAANWAPTRTTPANTDRLIFSGTQPGSGATMTCTNFSQGGSTVIGQIHVINNATVTIYTAANTTPTPQSGGLIDSGNEPLLIDTGSTLRVASTAGFSCALTIPTATTGQANIKGTIVFNPATALLNRIQCARANGIIFRSGSRCFAAPAASPTGGVFGASISNTVDGGVIFQSGSKYYHGVDTDLATRSGGNYGTPFQLAAPASMVVFQTGSEAIYYQGSGFIPTSRTFSDLTLRCNSNEVNLGVPTAVRNLNIQNNGTVTQNLVSFAGTGAMTVGGILTIDANSGGFADAHAGRTMTVTGGVVANGAYALGANTLNANVTVGSAGSISATGNGGVLGTITRSVAAATGSYNFPVKSATATREAVVNFTAAPSAPTQLVVDYLVADPTENGLPLVDGPLNCVSIADEGYWSITAPGAVDGTYDVALDGAAITPHFADPTQVRVAKRANSAAAWALEGSAGASAGTVVEQSGLTGFSEFALVGSSAQVPVSISGFSID